VLNYETAREGIREKWKNIRRIQPHNTIHRKGELRKDHYTIEHLKGRS
jgi:hypothetical protein